LFNVIYCDWISKEVTGYDFLWAVDLKTQLLPFEINKKSFRCGGVQGNIIELFSVGIEEIVDSLKTNNTEKQIVNLSTIQY